MRTPFVRMRLAARCCASVATLPSIAVRGDDAVLLQPAATGTLPGLTPLQTPASLDIADSAQLRERGAVNKLEMAGYTTPDPALIWEARRDLTLALRGYNVFDRQYAETAYDNQTQWLVGEGRRAELSANDRF
ncbi:Outer membrane receptor for monomeric catechols [Bordetella pseudohinzii]|uniref:Outer membrane receptor for monomeric catechols n=2 Tax=Bordetella pseudohinzii TaxID=1331258 RepID=A0A0M7F2Y6_9BORD|nr:Outer membrane receptor for monomeric catechols [Bordetella pseudohinzii]